MADITSATRTCSMETGLPSKLMVQSNDITFPTYSTLVSFFSKDALDAKVKENAATEIQDHPTLDGVRKTAILSVLEGTVPIENSGLTTLTLYGPIDNNGARAYHKVLGYKV